MYINVYLMAQLLVIDLIKCILKFKSFLICDANLNIVEIRRKLAKILLSAFIFSVH